MSCSPVLPKSAPRQRKRVFAVVGACFALCLGTAGVYFSCNARPAGHGAEISVPLDDPLEDGHDLPDEARVSFRDLAKAAGISFLHINSPSEMHYVPEIMGGGAAWIDYDRDGYMDLVLVQGGRFPVPANEKHSGPTTRLYHNNGDGTFTDVTEQSGIWHPSFGQGVTVGDYDNDGFPDLFITCYGHCHLFHNEPDGKGGRRFREVTREAGVELDGWCTSCAFGDVHGTGRLDLFVCRYVQMDFKNYPDCGEK